jgi:hypothetical protein
MNEPKVNKQRSIKRLSAHHVKKFGCDQRRRDYQKEVKHRNLAMIKFQMDEMKVEPFKKVEILHAVNKERTPDRSPMVARPPKHSMNVG